MTDTNKLIVFHAIIGSVFAFIFLKNISIDSIKSKTRLEPQIELIIENNKIDTLYVYRAKKD